MGTTKEETETETETETNNRAAICATLSAIILLVLLSLSVGLVFGFKLKVFGIYEKEIVVINNDLNISGVCLDVKCDHYSHCLASTLNRSQCVCPECEPVYSPVCSDRNVTYASKCHLQRSACLKETDDFVLKDSACGIAGAVDVLYVLDTSSDTSLEELTTMKQFIQTSMQVFTVSKNHFRIAVTGMSNILEIGSWEYETNDKEVKAMIDKIKPVGGNRDIETSLKSIDKTSNRMRIKATKTVIFVLTGNNFRNATTEIEKTTKSLKEKNIHFYVIIIGNEYNEKEAIAVTGKKENVFNPRKLDQLPYGIRLVEKFISNLTGICLGVKCNHYSQCVASSLNKAQCVCPECEAVYSPVCSDRNVTYASECHLQRSACLEGTDNFVLKNSTCGISGAVDMLYVLDTSSDTSLGEVTTMKYFVQTSIKVFTVSQNQFRIAVTGMSNILEIGSWEFGTNYKDVEAMIDKIKLVGGNRDIETALKSIDKTSYRMRIIATKTVVFILTGNNFQNVTAEIEKTTKLLKEKNIHFYMLIIGHEYDEKEAMAVTGKKENVFNPGELDQLPYGIRLVERFISDLIGVCLGVKCNHYSYCTASSLNKAQCVCPECEAIYSPVCSDRIVTYASECHLQRSACLEGTDEFVLKNSACGISGAVDVLYALDTSSDTSLEELTSMKEFVQTSIEVFTLSKSQGRIAVTGMSNILDIGSWEFGTNDEEVKAMIDKIKPVGGNRDIETSLKSIDETSNRMRIKATKTIVFIITGSIFQNATSDLEKTTKSLKEKNIQFYIIIIGNEYNEKEAIAVTGKKENIFNPRKLDQLQYGITLVERFISALSGICIGVKCNHYSYCTASSLNEAQCVCPDCEAVYSPVCSDRNVTYASECHLQRAACLEGTDDFVLKNNACGISGAVDVLYVLDTSSDTSLEELTSMKEFVQTSIEVFTLSKSQGRIAVTGMSNILDIGSWEFGTNHEEVKAMIDKIKPVGGKRDIETSLMSIDKTSDRMRIKATKTIIFILTGDNFQNATAKIKKTAKSLKEKNIHFYVIIIGNEYNEKEAIAVTGKKENVFNPRKLDQLAYGTVLVERFISALTGICLGVKCNHYSYCTASSLNKAQCVCPECEAVYSPVCSDRNVTYASECHLQRSACLEGTDDFVSKNRACGISGAVDMLYVLDTSSDTSLGEVTTMKQFVQTSIKVFTVSQNQFRIAVTGLSNILEIGSWEFGTNYKDVEAMIDKIKLVGGNRDIETALKSIDKTSYRMRIIATKTVVFILTGNNFQNVTAEIEKTTKLLKEKNIHFYMLIIGNEYNEKEAMAVTGKKENVFNPRKLDQLPYGIGSVERFISDLIGICSGVKCNHYSYCTASSLNKAQCVCPECEAVYSPVCSDRNVTYASECHLQRSACLEGTDDFVLKNSTCGNAGAVDMLYVLDTSSDTSLEELTSMKQFVQTCFEIFTLSKSQGRVAATGMSNILEVGSWDFGTNDEEVKAMIDKIKVVGGSRDIKTSLMSIDKTSNRMRIKAGKTIIFILTGNNFQNATTEIKKTTKSLKEKNIHFYVIIIGNEYNEKEAMAVTGKKENVFNPRKLDQLPYGIGSVERFISGVTVKPRMIDLAVLFGPPSSNQLFKAEAEFIEKLFQNLSSSNTDLMYGIIAYGKSVNVKYSLGERTSLEVFSVISNLKREENGFDSEELVDTVTNRFFTTPSGNRKDAQKTVLMLTTNVPTKSTAFSLFNATNIKLILVGLGDDVNPALLASLLDERNGDSLFLPRNEEELINSIDNIADELIVTVACLNVKCQHYSHCIPTNSNKAHCVCPICETLYNPVCSNRGVTFASECHLKRAACLVKRDDFVLKNDACGIAGAVDVLYVLDTSSDTSLEELTDMKQFVQTSMGIFTLSKSQGRIAVTGMNNILDIGSWQFGTNVKEVKAMMDKIKPVGGKRDIETSLMSIDKTSDRMRIKATKTIIFIFTGDNFQNATAEIEKTTKSLKEKNIHFYVIIVGHEYNEKEAMAVTGNEENVFNPEKLDQLPYGIGLVERFLGDRIAPKQATNLAIVMGYSLQFTKVKEKLITSLRKVQISSEEVLPAIITYGLNVKTVSSIGDRTTFQDSKKIIENLINPPISDRLIDALDSASSIVSSKRSGAIKTIWVVLPSSIPDLESLAEKLDVLDKQEVNVVLFISSSVVKNILDKLDKKQKVVILYETNDEENEDGDITTSVDIIDSTKQDPCDIKVCLFSSQCVRRRDQTGECVCKVCNNDYKPICASNGLTYAAECYMLHDGCRIQENLHIVKEAACGIEETLEVVYLIDNSKQTHLSDLESIKTYISASLSFYQSKEVATSIQFVTYDDEDSMINYGFDLPVTNISSSVSSFIVQPIRKSKQLRDLKNAIEFVFNNVYNNVSKEKKKVLIVFTDGEADYQNVDFKNILDSTVTKDIKLLFVNLGENVAPTLSKILPDSKILRISNAKELPSNLTYFDIRIRYLLGTPSGFDLGFVFGSKTPSGLIRQTNYIINKYMPSLKISPLDFRISIYDRYNKTYPLHPFTNGEYKTAVTQTILNIRFNNQLESLLDSLQQVKTTMFLPSSDVRENSKRGVYFLIDKEFKTASFGDLDGPLNVLRNDGISAASIQIDSCPLCKLTDYSPVCGSDGRSYANQCYLEKSSCLFQRNIEMISNEPCGLSTSFLLVYAVDTSSLIKSADFKRIKAFAIASLDMFNQTSNIFIIPFSDTLGKTLNVKNGSINVLQSFLNKLTQSEKATKSNFRKVIDFVEANAVSRPAVLVLFTHSSSIDENTVRSVKNLNGLTKIVVSVTGHFKVFPEFDGVIVVENGDEVPTAFPELEEDIGLHIGPKIMLDIGFVMGATSTEKKLVFYKQKDLVLNILDDYIISPNNVLPAVVTYSANKVLRFGEVRNKKDVVDKVFHLRIEVSGDSLYSAIKYFADEMILPRNGARDKIAKSVVIFVDSDTQLTDNVRKVVDKLDILNVKVLFVGVGSDVYKDSLTPLVTDSDHMLYVEDTNDLPNRDKTVIDALSPDSMVCKDFQCFFNSICTSTSDDRAKCVCPLCIQSNQFIPVCANDGITYWNECYMKKTSCETKEDLHVIKTEQCGLAIETSIVFALDSSLSTSNETLNIFQDLVIKLMESLDTFKSTPRVAVISIGEMLYKVVGFKDIVTLDDIKKRIQLITPFNGTRSLKNTFQFVNDDLFTPEHESNNKILVLFLSNEKNAVDHYDYEVQLKNLKNKDIKIIVFALDDDMSSFKLIPSNEHLITYIKSRNDVPNVYGKLEDLIRGKDISLDFAFAITSTVNIQTFQEQKSFLQKLLTRYEISSQATIVSGLLYGRTANIFIPFINGYDLSSIQENINSLQNDGKPKALKDVLQLITNNVFTSTNGARNGFPKSLVLFISKETDLQGSDVLLQNLRSDEINIVIVAVDSDGSSFVSLMDNNEKNVISFKSTDDVFELVGAAVKGTFPDPCFNSSCEFYQKCFTLDLKNKTCVCPVCTDEKKFEPVCGSDGITYQSLCKLHSASCVQQQLVTVTKDEVCGLSGVYDIVYAIDTSVGVDFNLLKKTKEFIRNSLQIYSSNDTHIGLVQYAGSTDIRLPLWNGNNTEDITKMLDVIKLTGGERNISAALEKIDKEMFVADEKKYATQQVILITAGRSNPNENIIIQKAVNGLEKKKVNMLIVNVGNHNITHTFDAMNSSNIKVITTDPNKMLGVIGTIEKEIEIEMSTDPCEKILCQLNSACVVLADRSTKCMCKQCTDENKYEPVCGDNGQTYATKCRMIQESCGIKKTIKFSKYGVCETVDNLDTFYAFDTSKTITDEDISKLQQLAIATLDFYTFGASRTGIISFGNNVETVLEINQGIDRNRVQLRLNSIPMIKGDRNINKMLTEVQSLIDQTSKNKQLLIIFTKDDIEQSQLNDFEEKIKALKDKGVKVALISIGSKVDDNVQKLLDDVAVVKNSNELPRLYPDFEGFIVKTFREIEPVDIILLLGSHGNNADKMFIQQVDAAKALVKKYDVSSDKIVIGLVIYGKDAKSALSLQDGNNEQSILTKLSVLKNPDNENNLIDAMKYVMISAFSIQNGARIGVPKCVVLFLDEPFTDDEIELKDQMKRLEDNAIKIITVFIGVNLDSNVEDTFKNVFTFPESLDHKNMVVKLIVKSSGPDSCSGVHCTHSSSCEPRQIRRGACVCPNCENFKNYQQICGDNGLSYANLCRMRKHACVTRKEIKAVKLQSCGITGISEVVFAFDGSDNVTTNLFNKMKNFTGELLTSFSNPKYITLVSFSKSTFGKRYFNQNESSILTGLENLIKMKGQSSLKVLFDNTEIAGFGTTHVPKVFVVFLSRDNINNFNDVSLLADKLRIKGIETIFVGIGIGKFKQHRLLVSKDKYVLSVSHASNIPDLYGPLENAIKDAMALPVVLDLAVAFSMTGNDPSIIFNAEKQFVLNALSQFTITTEYTRPAILQYGRLSKIQYKFGELLNEEQTRASINNLILDVPGNNLLMMLKHCHEEVFTKAYGARDGIPKSLLIFNNQKTGSILADYKQKLDKLRNLGVKIVVIGISSMVDHNELKIISSNDAYFYSENLLELNDLIDPVVEELMPDPCIKSACKFSSKCVKVVQKGSCVCPLCTENDVYNILCGTNGETYANRCWMNRISCLKQKEIKIAKYEPCGIKVNIDTLYALDGSKNVSENDFNKMIAFVKAAAGSFDIGATKTRIGLMVFGEATETYLEFNSGISFDVFHKALLQARRIGGPRHVYNLLDDINKNIFTDDYIAGGKHPYLTILITGGDQSNTIDPHFSTAQALRNKGVHIITIVIGDENFLPDAGMISSHEHDVMFVEGSAIMLPGVLGDVEAFIGLSEAPSEKLDLGFIIGATGTFSQKHYEYQINFIEEMLESITISSTETLVGTIMNGHTPYIPIKLGDTVTYDDHIRVLKSLTNAANGNNLINAFQIARASLLSVENGARKNIPKSLLVFVDSNIVGDVNDLALEAKALQDIGIRIILVGMGNDFDANVYEELADVFLFAEEVSHLDHLISPVIHSVLPDKCIDNKCREYSTCLILPDRRTECVCTPCTIDYQMVCGDDFKTYASLCRLNRSICLYNTPSKAVSQGACDISGASDIVFLLDGSSSVSKNTFNEMQRFIHEVLTGFDLSLNATRASLAVHGSSILLGAAMTENQDLLYQSLQGLRPVGGLRQVGLGLQYALTDIFIGTNRKAAKVVVMFTTGPNDISGQQFMLSQANRLKSADVEIVIIAIGNTIDKTKFFDVVLHPPDVFEVTDINDLPDLLHKVIILSINERERLGLCNPSLYYNFANTSNGIVPDESGSNNIGMLRDGVRITGNSKCEKGAEFTDGHIEIDGKNFKGKPMEGVTIATWVWLEDINDPTHQLFVTIDPGPTNPQSLYDFGIATNGAIEFSHRRVFGRRTSPVIKQKVWTHIAATYDTHTDEVYVYVNGVEFTSFTRIDKQQLTEFSQNWEKTTSIGKFEETPDKVSYLRGRIDEYYIYPCALAYEQVNKLRDQECTEKPAACDSVKCSFYAECFVNSNGLASCECPKSCDKVPKQNICGNDGQTYINDCEMRSFSCQIRKLVTNAHNGRCEYNLHFDGFGSYQTLRNPTSILKETHLEFSISPESDDGVLFYSMGTKSDKGFDYFVVLLVHGHVEFRFDNGKGQADLTSDEQVMLNQWNTIIITRSGRDGSMVVNGGTPKSTQTPGKFKSLNVDPICYLGGIGPKPRPNDVDIVGTTTSFRGCIKTFSINDIDMNLQYPGPNVVKQHNTSASCFVNPCESDPCQFQSTCTPTSAHTYQCKCAAGYQGTNCEQRAYAIPQVPAEFNGASSYVSYLQMLDGKHEHEIFISFLSEKPDGLLLYAQGPSGIQDYLLIFLQNKKVVCSFDLGTGNHTFVSQRSFATGHWVDLRLTRHDKHMEMFFFQRRVASGTSPGAFEIINLHTVFYIGKAKKLLFGKSHHPSVHIPFKGCIRALKIDDYELKFRTPGKYILESVQVKSCAVCHKRILLSFVFDASTSVGADGYYHTKQFIKSSTNYFDFHGMKVSVIDFADKGNVKIPYNRVNNYNDFATLLDSFTYVLTPGNAIIDGLEVAFYELIDHLEPGESYVVLLTSSPLVTRDIDFIKAMFEENGATLIVVGIGNEVTRESLSTIASEGRNGDAASNLFMTDSYESLIGLIVPVREYICKISRSS